MMVAPHRAADANAPVAAIMPAMMAVLPFAIVLRRGWGGRHADAADGDRGGKSQFEHLHRIFSLR